MNASIAALVCAPFLVTGPAAQSATRVSDPPRIGSRRPVDVSLEGLGEASARTSDRSTSEPGSPAERLIASPAPLDCLESIVDQATGGCVNASSTPTLGMLMPYPGINNTFVGPSSIAGGENNQASGWSTVAGGKDNTASGDGYYSYYGYYGYYATVGGGVGNQAIGWGCTVGGGQGNVAKGALSTVAGGGGSYGGYSGPNGFNTADGVGATVGGGSGNVAYGRWSTVGGGQFNRVSGVSPFSPSRSYGHATMSGGYGNNAYGWSPTIGGGAGNRASGSSVTIGGGFRNTALGYYATVAGGSDNIAHDRSVVAGGHANLATGDYATVGGGEDNVASGTRSTVPGGNLNTASGSYSFAAGRRAKANHQGSFVWGDSHDNYPALSRKTSSTSDQFNVYASGGVRMFTNSAATTGVLLAPGGSTWTMVSDRDAKENVEPVDARAVLDEVARLPLATWNYRDQDDSIRHMGPMAQDFYAAFGLGLGERTIDTIDPNGVALAAIQGLDAELEERLAEKDAEIAELRRQVATRLSALEARLAELTERLETPNR